MKDKVEKALALADQLGEVFNGLVKEADDLDLKRMFKQLEADMMDTRHKLALAIKIIAADKG